MEPVQYVKFRYIDKETNFTAILFRHTDVEEPVKILLMNTNTNCNKKYLNSNACHKSCSVCARRYVGKFRKKNLNMVWRAYASIS